MTLAVPSVEAVDTPMRRTSRSLFARVTVFGGGTMGGGIAQVTAMAGMPVTVVDIDDATCAKSQATVARSLARVAKKKFETDEAKQKEWTTGVLSKIIFTSDSKAAVSNAELVIEAITERIEAKTALWKAADAAAPAHCVFASNTSSLSIDEQAAATKRAGKFGGLHFFSPVPMMKLVEVVKGKDTTPETHEALTAFVKKIGKAPVTCIDTKGFVVNRLLIPYMLESARLVERGVASVEDVDTAMKLGAGYPMGPFTLCDSVGIDVIKLITDKWHKEEPENPLFTPVKLIDEKVAAGKLGRKTGEGFYKY